MSLDSIVKVDISRSTKAVSREGFGVPLILGPNAAFSGLQYYSSIDAVAQDFLTTTDEYKAALSAFGQTLKPTKVGIAKRTTNVAQVETLTVVTAINSHLYRVVINGLNADYTSDSSATAAEIQAGLVAAINALTPAQPLVAAPVGGTQVSITSSQAGIGFTISTTAGAELTITHSTANNGPVEDLIATQHINDDWYGFGLTSRDNAEQLAVAAWAESVKKLFFACSSDAAVLTSATTDIASKLKAKGYARTDYLWSGDQASFPEFAWMGGQLPETPGSNTWKFKTLNGITADNLTETQITFLESKNANFYKVEGGVAITQEGKVAVGEFIDVIIGIDWIHSNMQADVYEALVNEKKIPFTDNGVAVIENIVTKRLNLAVKAGILAASPAPVVTAPLVADISTGDKAIRSLKNVNWTATLAGAIHEVEISGNVTV